ncbi:MAG: NACHT domain-containing protein [Caldilineaceae bacterium]
MRFIGYLWDDLRLRDDPDHFEACWDTLVAPLALGAVDEQERAELHLPDAPPSSEPQSGGQTTTINTGGGAAVTGDVNSSTFVGRDIHNYILFFSEQYQQQDRAIDPDQLERALREYLAWLEESTRTIELRGIPARGNVVSLPLAEIFVPLRAELADQRRQQEERTLALDQVLTVGKQLAVIGGPGSGKSTVLQYIAWVLAKALLENNGDWATQKLGLRLTKAEPLPPLPIYLPLSAYARLRFHNPDTRAAVTFPAFIEHYLEQSHCNLGGLPPDFFRNLLEQGHRVILLLDGLDEVANEGEREIVTQTIENLVAGRGQQLRVVVTCRSVAYKGQAILTRGFRQVNVQALDSKHVERLVQQAYRAVYDINAEERAARTDELLGGITRLEAEQARRQRTTTNEFEILLMTMMNEAKHII